MTADYDVSSRRMRRSSFVSFQGRPIVYHLETDSVVARLSSDLLVSAIRPNIQRGITGGATICVVLQRIGVGFSSKIETRRGQPSRHRRRGPVASPEPTSTAKSAVHSRATSFSTSLKLNGHCYPESIPVLILWETSLDSLRRRALALKTPALSVRSSANCYQSEDVFDTQLNLSRRFIAISVR
jgi:hypothetical protein